MMRSSGVSRSLCLALLATSAHAQQTVGAGAKAVVNSDSLPVYGAMSSSGEVKATLKRGDRVTIGVVLFGDDVTWCAITRAGETRRLGFASCEFLEQDRGGVTTAPPPPVEPKKPIPVREVPLPPPAAATVPPEPVAPSKPAQAVVKETAPAEPFPAPPAAVELPPPKRIPAPEPPVREPDPPAVAIALPADPAPLAPVVPPPPPAPVAEPAPAPTPHPTESTPAAPPLNPADFVEAALDNSGLRASLTRYTRTTNLISFLDKGRLAEIDVNALDRVLSEQFEPAVFSRAIGDQIGKNYSPKLLPELVEWLRSPVTQKLAGLERRALEPESREELVAFAADLSKSRPAESRLELAHRLYDASKICDVEVESTIALVYTVALAIGPALPKEKRYSAGELDRALGSVKSRYRSIMKNARLVHYLFAYQSASEAELEQYVGFLESESGRLFVSLIGKGFYDATEAISRRLLIEIPRNLKRR
jgi:hypothetical protein